MRHDLDRFEWQDGKLVHVLTGARFTPGSDFVNFGKAGEVVDGVDTDRADILERARKILAERQRLRRKSTARA